MIQINGTISLAPGTIANSPETVEAIKTMVAASRAEDGCYTYTFAQDLSDPDTIIIYERWRDQEALGAHGKSAHMAEFQKVMAANPPVGRDLRMYQTDDGQPL
ncbi:putative quinol monooxygenase [Parerythrobacter jejuensis]|uniref:Antibiotic biosynthesis monooxygenase n=1 Tax=Parerythrobacter jejuensis TaxID=795812 RepID=A0A845AR44_9SPHN|nr:putative quinol monooxygenase [Parerythrobacter jejuensis]MXP31867.1 antibiotic biosynthesis monooxygenase [Parerythrobacter jejuensis]